MSRAAALTRLIHLRTSDALQIITNLIWQLQDFLMNLTSVDTTLFIPALSLITDTEIQQSIKLVEPEVGRVPYLIIIDNIYVEMRKISLINNII